MQPGFGYNQQGRKFQDDNSFNRANEMARFQQSHQDNIPPYQYNQQFFEEGGNDAVQIPHHIKILFDSDEKLNFDPRTQRMGPGGMPNMGMPGMGMQGMATQNMGLQNMGMQNMQNMGMQNIGIANREQVRQMPPNQMLHQNMAQSQFQNMNNFANQTNDFARLANVPKDLDASNLSNRESLTNISRDSRTESKPNLNSSKRNASSRSNVKEKNYQVSINDDISLIERIEISLNQITLNHNKICPFCSKLIDIRKCNFQNISAFMSNTSRKYYLTHFDCYLKSNSSHSAFQIIPLTGIVEARINSQTNSLTSIDTSNFLRSDRRAYFVNIEGYHPISSFLLFKIEKLCHGLEHATHRNHLLYLNLANPTTSIFEPQSYTIPFSEFRVLITIHTSHSNEDPYTYEFLVDFSQIKMASDQKMKPIEVFYLHGENNIVMGTQIVFDVNAEMSSMPNLDSSFQSTGSTNSAKPDFGKNLFIVLKYFSISLPLKKVEKRTKDITTGVQEENPTPVTQQKSAPQKKTHTKLQLNPNAPLFSTPNAAGGFEPNNSQPFYPPMGGNRDTGNFIPNNPGFKQPANGNFGAYNMTAPGNNMPVNMGGSMGNNLPGNMGNTAGPSVGNNLMGNVHNPMGTNPHNPLYYNMQQQYGPNYQMEQNINQFNKIPQGPQEMGYPAGFSAAQQGGFKPPGLVGPSNNQNNLMNQQFTPQQMFPTTSTGMNDSPNKKKTLQVDTRSANNLNNFKAGPIQPIQPGADLSLGLEFSEMPMTPDKLQGDDFDNQNMERGRLNKNTLANNLYTAVLSGKRRESSQSKSPSLSKIQNKYFSGFSTPRSENTFTPPQANTPLKRLTPTGSSAELPGGDDGGDQPWTEDMIENFKLENYIENLVEFAKTYNGSRVLQKFFPRANQNEIDAVINKIQDNIDELMLDPYANYMFQTLAQSCSSEQRYHLLQKIAPSMVKIACDRKGTHSLQAIVSLISREIEEKLIRETLDGHVLDLALDAQGTHLIQKIIVAISLVNIDFIYEPVIERFIDIANNSYGLCVLKQLMTKAEKSDKMRQTIVQLLYEHLEDLIQNPFGNYAVQHALDSYPKHCNMILDKILDKIIQYSNQKFSSNVIEKCLILSTPEYRKRFVKEILKSDRIVELMKNKYGNFVILKVLATAEQDDKVAVMQSLMKNVHSVNVTKYKNRWMQFIDENPLKIPGFNTMQTVKPSLFKNNVNSPLPLSEDNFSRDASDNDAGMMGEDWNDPRQEGKKKSQKPSSKEEKSQFFYTSNKPTGNFAPNYHEGEEFFGFNTGGYPEGVFVNQGFRPENHGERGQNVDYNNFKKNKQQYPAQKPFQEKPNDSKKWGYNNFY